MTLSLNFTHGYSGPVSIYSVDWDSTDRRQSVSIGDGTSTSQIAFSDSMHDGRWATSLVNVPPAGGAVTISSTSTGSYNSVISGIFLGSADEGVEISPTVGSADGGNWYDRVGHDGYILPAWNNGDDLASLPEGVEYESDGQDYVWTQSTPDNRALESPDQTFRRVTSWYGSPEINVNLTFPNGYNGDISLYSVDWDGGGRSQQIIISGGGTTAFASEPDFVSGAWVTTSVSVGVGSQLNIKVIQTGNYNALLNGIFLGGSGYPYPRGTMTPTVAPQGSWKGIFGSDAYILPAFGGAQDVTSDLGAKGISYTLDAGGRYPWVASDVPDARALQDPGTSSGRKYGVFFDSSQVRVTISFTQAYEGNLHLYASDWDSEVRRQTVVVSAGGRRFEGSFSSSYHDGTWVGTPISVPAGGTVEIVASNDGPYNALLGGIFLGGVRPVASPSVLNSIECGLAGGNIFFDHTTVVDGTPYSGCYYEEGCVGTLPWLLGSAQEVACDHMDFLMKVLRTIDDTVMAVYQHGKTIVASPPLGGSPTQPPTDFSVMKISDALVTVAPTAGVLSSQARTAAMTQSGIESAGGSAFVPIAATGILVGVFVHYSVQYLEADAAGSAALHENIHAVDDVAEKVADPVDEDDPESVKRGVALGCIQTMTGGTLETIASALGVVATTTGFVNGDHICSLIPVYMPADNSRSGKPMPMTTHHIKLALGMTNENPVRQGVSVNPEWVIQTKKFGHAHDRSWLGNEVVTTPTGGSDMCATNHDELVCDEFPFASSEEGGQGQSPKVSLYQVPQPEGGVQGGDLTSFNSVCGIVAGSKYAVVPMPSVSWLSVNSAFIC
jgi:hypothetical protein